MLVVCEYGVGGSKQEQEQAKQLEVTGQDGDVSAATIVPSVRAFPTRHLAKHGVKYREEEGATVEL